MNQHAFNLNTVRLALSGAILGIAVMGLFSSYVSQVPYHDVIGAITGGASVIFAKARHFI